jgi:diacylglycerol kinase (ATP)
MKSALLIVNPSSGRERATDASESLVAGIRQRYDEVTVVVTAGDGDAGDAARRAAAEGCSTIFVAGGDGTLNEALNGVAAVSALDRIRFGIVPLGTGNDFAAALGIPTDLDAALQTLLAERELRVDVGVVNGRCFLNTSGGGYIAEVSVAVTPQLKTIAGRLAYLIGGDGRTRSAPARPAHVCICRLQFTPDRRRQDHRSRSGHRRRIARRMRHRGNARDRVRRAREEGGGG